MWPPPSPASSDAVVLSPEFADRYLAKWHLPVLHDLRGKFTGAETGSKKNDAYRWAIREYLAKGRCSSQLLCLFEDSFSHPCARRHRLCGHARLGGEEPGLRLRPFALGRRDDRRTIPASGRASTWRPTA